jgi:hypothetical protein
MHRDFFEAERLYVDSDRELDLITPNGKRAKWRHFGIGPTYHKFGRKVVYAGSDLNTWVAQNRVETHA